MKTFKEQAKEQINELQDKINGHRKYLIEMEAELERMLIEYKKYFGGKE